MRPFLVLAAVAFLLPLVADDRKETVADVDPAKLVGKWNGTKLLGRAPAAGESATLEFTKGGLALNGRDDKTDEILVVKLTDTVLHIRQVARKENMVDEFERAKGK